MKLTLTRLTIALLGTSLMLLAGCANHAARPGPAEAGSTQPAPESSARSRTQPSETRGAGHATHVAHPATTGTPEQASGLPENTGVPACDDYLSSYVACHRAAAIYKPDEIEGRYEAMRTSLLRDAQDPSTRPNLATRCNALASQLRQALHGKSCEGAPVPSSSSE